MVTTYLQRVRLFSHDARLFLISSALVRLTVYGGIYAVLLNPYLLRLGSGPQFIGLVNEERSPPSRAFTVNAQEGRSIAA